MTTSTPDPHLTPPYPPPSPIVSAGNELLVQFVSDLSVTADGFSASYVHRSPHDPPTSHKDPPPDPPKPKNAAKNAKASPPTPPQTQPPPTATPCP